MLRYSRGRGLLRFGEAWFGEGVDGDEIDILEHVQAKEPPGRLPSRPFPSLLIDLGLSPEELLASFEKTTRYEVRRALGKDGVQTSWMVDPAHEVLQNFAADYDRFARSRHLPPVQLRRLGAIQAACALVLSRADLEGSTLSWHAYIRVGDRARLLLSSTADRSPSSEQRAQIGRANRALHYADGLAAQASGAKWLDLGGISGQVEGPLRSVDAFKQSFGGLPVVGWNATEARSARGRAALAVLQLRARARRGRHDAERSPAR